MSKKCIVCESELNDNNTTLNSDVCDECSSIYISTVLFGGSLVMLQEIKKLKVQQLILFVLVIILGVLVLWN